MSKLIPSSSSVCVWNPSLVRTARVHDVFHTIRQHTVRTECRRTNETSSNRVRTVDGLLWCHRSPNEGHRRRIRRRRSFGRAAVHTWTDVTGWDRRTCLRRPLVVWSGRGLTRQSLIGHRVCRVLRSDHRATLLRVLTNRPDCEILHTNNSMVIWQHADIHNFTSRMIRLYRNRGDVV